MSSKYDSSLKSEVCEYIRKGERVSEVSKRYGIPKSTISGWLEKGAGGQNSQSVELGRLKRENEALLKILGRVVYEQDFLKKKRYR